MADAVIRRTLAARFGPELHGRLTALLDRSTPDEARAALAAVAARHVPLPEDWGTVCCSCWAEHGIHPLYPCTELLDIIEALAGEEIPDA